MTEGIELDSLEVKLHARGLLEQAERLVTKIDIYPAANLSTVVEQTRALVAQMA